MAYGVRYGLSRLRRHAVGALVIVATLVAGLLMAPTAFADPVIGFDDLAIGTTVTSQYQADGVQLGAAATFGQVSPGKGDCGGPQVASGAITAYSSPNYAKLAICSPPAGESAVYYAGTYGALTSPQSYVSIEVQLPVGVSATAMSLTGYDASGAVVASGTVTGVSGSWSLLSATQIGGATTIRYFEITTVNTAASAPVVLIDDLGFGAGGGSVGSSAPGANIQVTTPNPTGGQPVDLSGAGSTLGVGKIISYDWDFNDDGKSDTSTGTNPNASFIFAPGRHVVGLTVTTSGGQQSKTSVTVTVVPGVKAPPLPDGGVGPCQPSVTIGNVQILAYCIQSDGSGGYVISTADLSLNGTTLVTKDLNQAAFHVTQFNHLGIGSGWQLTGPAVNVELLNTPIGNVTLGGEDLTANPVDLTFKAFVPPKVTAPILNPQLRAGHGLLRGFPGAYVRNAFARPHDTNTAGKSLLFTLAVGKQCNVGDKGVSCCPKSTFSECATLPGGFPITGSLSVYTNAKQQMLIDVQVGVQLPGFQATGALEIETDSTSGVNLNSLQFTIPQAGLANVFQVTNASFTYYFPSYPDPTKADSWQAKATIQFGPLNQPNIAGELDFLRGQFHFASLVFTTPPPGIPVYPGVFLNQFGAGVGVNPTVVSGTLGANIASTIGLTLSFKYSDPTATQLGFFGGQGSVTLAGQKLATLEGDVYSDGYTDAELDIGIQYPQDHPVIQLAGKASFWDEPSSGLWQFQGSLDVSIWILSAEAAALANNNYIAACGSISLGPFGTAGAQGRYEFSDGSIGGGLFTNDSCSDQLKQYAQTPVTQHSGGYVGSTRRGSGQTAAVQTDTFKLPSGQLGEELLISGNSGTPVVTISGPRGIKFTTPSQPQQIVAGKNYVAALEPDAVQVVVLLKRPHGGTWTLQPGPGSPVITSVKNAAEVGPAKVKATVARSTHGRFTLHYRVTNHVPGSHVQFVERGRDSTHVLGTVSATSGTLGFMPQDAIGRRRTIDAVLLDTSGVPQRTLVAGHYTAPAAARGGRVTAVKFARKRTAGALLTWAPAPGAREYRVVVHGSDGRTVSRVLRAKTRRLTLVAVLPTEHFTATVTALGGPNLLAGPSHRAALAAASSGRAELLACKQARCTPQVVSGSLVLTANEIKATLSRGGRTYANGISADASGKRLSFAVTHGLPRGRYTLTLSRGAKTHSRKGTVTIT